MEIPSLHIVIVEDDTHTRDMLCTSLEALKMKTSIQVFENGLRLKNYLNNPHVIPDLFFLKMHLPLLNGSRCVKAIRAQRIMNRALLLVYAPIATEAEIEEVLVERANIYMNIPKEPYKLEKELEEILKLAFQYKHSNLSVENLICRL